MPKFTMEIKLGNDALTTSDDLSHILTMTGIRISNAGYVEQLSGEFDPGLITRGILDGNGNSVGSWTLRNQEDDEEEG